LAVVERVRREYGEGAAADGHVEEELKKKGGKKAGAVGTPKLGGKKGKASVTEKANSVVDLASEPEPELEDDSIDAGAGGFLSEPSRNHSGDHNMSDPNGGSGGFLPSSPTHDDHANLHSAGGFILENDDGIAKTDTGTATAPARDADAGPRKPRSLMAMAKHAPASPDEGDDHKSSLSSLQDNDDDMVVSDDAAPTKRTSKVEAKANAKPAAKVKPAIKVKPAAKVKPKPAVKATPKVAPKTATKKTPAAAKTAVKAAKEGKVKSKYFAVSDDDDEDDDEDVDMDGDDGDGDDQDDD